MNHYSLYTWNQRGDEAQVDGFNSLKEMTPVVEEVVEKYKRGILFKGDVILCGPCKMQEIQHFLNKDPLL